MKVEIREIPYADFAKLLDDTATALLPTQESLHPQALICGAFLDDELVGGCCCQREDRIDENHLGVFRLVSLFVDPEFRGRGIARLLLLRSAAYVKRFKGRYIWCRAEPSLTIFLRKCGFYVELPTQAPADGQAIFIRDTDSF